MAERELKIILSLENRQFQVEAVNSTVRVRELTAGVEDLEKSVKKLPVAPATGSIADLARRLSEARTQVEAVLPGTTQYENALKRLTVVTTHYDRAQSTVANTLRGNLRPGANEASYAMFNMTRIVSDSAWGWIGVSNNIEPAIQSFLMVVRTTGSVKTAMASMVSSLAGPAGVMMAVSVATTALTLWSQHSRSAKQDTEDLAKEAKELAERVRTLQSTFEETAKATSEYKKKLQDEDIANEEKYISTLESLIKKGGMQSKMGFIPYSNEQLAKLNKELSDAKKHLNELGDEANKGGSNTQAHILAMKTLVLTAQSGNNELITGFAKATGLTENQLRNLINNLRDYKKNVLTVNGEISGNISKEQIELANKIKNSTKDLGPGISYDQLIKGLKNLDEYEEKVLSGKAEKNHKTVIDIINDELRLHDLRFEWGSEDLQTYRNFLAIKLASNKKSNAEELEQAISLRDKLKEIDNKYGLGNIKHEGIPGVKTVGEIKDTKIEEMTVGQRPSIWTERDKKNLEWMVTAADMTKNAFEQTGDAIVDAMFGAKVSIGEVVSEIGKLIAKMVLMKTITGIVDVLFPQAKAARTVLGFLGAGSDAKGGLVGYEKDVAYVSPLVFAGAKAYATGGLVGDAVPIIAHRNEMVLNGRQQANLFNLINDGGLLDYRFPSASGNRIDLNITGTMESYHDKFVMDLSKAQKIFNNRLIGS